MKAAAIVVASIGVLLALAANLIRMLARRVVGVEPRRKTITVRRVGDDIELPRSELTIVDGNYGLWFGDNFAQHALVGSVVASDERHVVRRVLRSTASLGAESFEAQWTGHIQSGPGDIDPDWEDVAVPLRDGSSAPAWLFRGASDDVPWVIHVQGIRTSRLVTLRSVEVAQGDGLTSLVITYRGSGDGPSASASTLGQSEWSDLADAVAYARARGAHTIFVVAWSMGAGLALELLRRDSGAFEGLVLIAPATNWRRIIRHGVQRAGLPAFVAGAVLWALSSAVASRFIGLPAPLDFERLDWIRSESNLVPTLVLHSEGDGEIPFTLTETFAAAHPNVELVRTASAQHGWEANVDPGRFNHALRSWLVL